MNKHYRIAEILRAAEERKVISKFQTDFSGKTGRHRLEIFTDDILHTSIVAYADSENFEEKMIEIEIHLGIVEVENGEK